jgi:nucleotidyltransferase/DNA polymerase involved in DNA repair
MYGVKSENNDALAVLCADFCSKTRDLGTNISNTLKRYGVRTIRDLHEIDIDKIKRFRGFGGMKLAYILQMKIHIESLLND